MNSKMEKVLAVLGTIFVLASIVISQVTTSKTNEDPIKPAASGTSCNTTDVVAQTVQEWGFDLNDVSINNIDKSLPGATSNRGGAFSHKPLLSEDDLSEFLASADDRAVETRLLLGNMDDVTWTSVQTLVPVVHPEMKIFVNGTSVSANSVTVPQGDVIWVATRDCKVVDLVRGACGNMVVQHPVPVYTYSRDYRHHDSGCKHDCGGGDHKCKHDCGSDKCKHDCGTKEKPDQSYDCKVNGGDGCKPNGGHQDPQKNDEDKVKDTDHKGDGDSSKSSGGGKDSSPSGGGSDGSGGTHADNDSKDTKQGGDNDDASKNDDAKSNAS